MRSRPTFPRLLGISLLAAAAMLLATAASALAITAPGLPGGTTYTQGTSSAVTWTAATPTPGSTIIRYEGGLGAAPTTDLGATPGTFTVAHVAAGTYTVSVRAIEQGVLPVEVPGPYASRTIVVDRTPPTITAGFSPAAPNGDNGWYRSLTTVMTCADAQSGILSCAGGGVISTQGANQTRVGTATDRAGNTATATTPVFNFDGAAPRQATLRQPTPRSTVTGEPTFVWGPSSGTETSGFNRYEVWARIGGTYRKIAQLPHVVGQTEYRATRDPSLWPTVLPKNVAISWYVRTVDNAGNGGGGTGQARIFTINPNAPVAPTITGGPAGLTNQTSPTFSWSGDQPAYTWGVFAADNDTALREGSGAPSQATPTSLPEGVYTFRVSQVNAFGDEGDEAVRDFTVDTTPPGAPVITARPPFPTSNPAPSFSWSMEPGASARWQVLAGNTVLQTSDTPSASATVAALSNGAYVFRVVQIDTAGNASPPAAEPFTIASAAGAPAKTVSLTSLLPLQNSKRLSPRPGRTLLTRTPVLQWVKGPKGTTLYNVQLFKVIRKRPTLPPVVRKVYSTFPRTTQLRLPKRATLPGTCYVWRVWPYTGKRFTKAPLGISNFCIASSKAIAKAAKAAKTRAKISR